MKTTKKVVDIWNSLSDTAVFKEGRLCSERMIQAELYRLFTKNLDDCKIWVEPKLSPGLKRDSETAPVIDIGGIIPDIVITKGQKIIGFIELKYDLNLGINYVHDLKKFEHLEQAKNDIEIPLVTNYRTGDWQRGTNAFQIDSHCQYYFGVVTWKDTAAGKFEKISEYLNEMKSINIQENFHHLTYIFENSQEKTRYDIYHNGKSLRNGAFIIPVK